MRPITCSLKLQIATKIRLLRVLERALGAETRRKLKYAAVVVLLSGIILEALDHIMHQAQYHH